jgi:hypothetical protein
MYVCVKGFFFVNVLFFQFSLFIPRPSTGAAASLKRAIRFKLCTFLITIVFSSESTFSPLRRRFHLNKDLKMSRYCAY